MAIKILEAITAFQTAEVEEKALLDLFMDFEAWAVAELLSEQHKVGETTSLDNFSGKLLNFILKQWNMKLYIQ